MNGEREADQNEIEVVSTSLGYDPLQKIVMEQSAFDDAWVGNTGQHGKVQRIGFFMLSLAFAAVGILVCVESASVLRDGVVFMFGVGAFMTLIGSMGRRVARRVLEVGIELGYAAMDIKVLAVPVPKVPSFACHV